LRRALKQKETRCFLGFLSVLEFTVPEVVRKSNLSPNAKSRLNDLLCKYETVFPDKMPGLPLKRGFEHEINLADDKPVHRMPYSL
jgi:hypothetical protein